MKADNFKVGDWVMINDTDGTKRRWECHQITSIDDHPLFPLNFAQGAWGYDKNIRLATPEEIDEHLNK